MIDPTKGQRLAFYFQCRSVDEQSDVFNNKLRNHELNGLTGLSGNCFLNMTYMSFIFATSKRI